MNKFQFLNVNVYQFQYYLICRICLTYAVYFNFAGIESHICNSTSHIIPYSKRTEELKRRNGILRLLTEDANNKVNGVRFNCYSIVFVYAVL